MRAFTLAALGILAAPAAGAHDAWGDGGPVPPWVKTICCGENDVHWYKPESVTITAQGYVLPNYPVPIPMSKAVPSPSNDGLYWVFFARPSSDKGMNTPDIYCFFVPPSGV